MKKLILLLLSLTVVLAAQLTASAAAKQETADNVTSSLGITEGIDTGSDYISRYDFALMLSRLLPGGAAPDNTEYYSDVPRSSTYYGIVNYLTSIGVFSGQDNTQFNGEAPITLENAAAAIVRLTGYSTFAENLGGYPAGYANQASAMGLYDGINDSESDAQKIIIMVYNTLNVHCVTYNGRETSQSSENILQETFDVVEYKGRLTAVGSEALSSGLEVGNGYIRLGDEIFEIDPAKAEEFRVLLGQELRAGIQAVSGAGEKLMYYTVTDRYDVLEFNLKQLDSISGTSITYDTGTRLKTINMVSAPNIVYNGRPASYIPELGNIGSIKLLQNSSKYDTIIIENYESHNVSAVFPEQSEIRTDGTDPLPKLDDVTDVRIINDKNEIISLADIKTTSVLSVARSIDSNYIRIIVSDKTLYGRVESFNLTDDDPTITVSAYNYAITKELCTKLIANDSDIIGIRGTFRLDAFGNITSLGDLAVTGKQLGYILKAYIDESETAYARILTDSGAVTDMEIEEKNGGISLNGTRIKAASFAENMSNNPQIVLYSESNGRIKAFEAAGGSGTGLYSLGTVSSARWRSSINSFAASMLLADDAIVFSIPNNANYKNDTTLYYATDSSAFMTGSTYSNLDFYAYKKDAMKANAVVYRYDVGGMLVQSGAPTLITREYASVNADNETVVSFDGLVGATKNTISGNGTFDINISNKTLSNNSSTPAAIADVAVAPGDIVRTMADSSGEVTSLCMVYDYSADTFYPSTNPCKANDDSQRYSFGYFEAIDENNIGRIRLDGAGVEYYDLTNAQIIIYDGTKDKNKSAVVGTINDIITGSTYPGASRVLVFSNSNAAAYVYVYK